MCRGVLIDRRDKEKIYRFLGTVDKKKNNKNNSNFRLKSYSVDKVS